MRLLPPSASRFLTPDLVTSRGVNPATSLLAALAALAARRHWIVGNMWVRVYTVTEDNVKGKRGAAAHSQL